MLYNKVPTDLKFVEREKEVSKFWKEHHIFEKSIEEREGCPEYMFYDGPPTANGKPHVGHVVTPCDQGYDPSLQNHERISGTEKSRLGYTRTSG